MDAPSLDWELEERLSSWNSAAWAIEDLIQVARNLRAMMILDKVYKAFFYCKDFIHWAYTTNILATFLLDLKIKLETGLYLQDEGYDIDANYGLLQLLNKTAYIYVVTSAVKTSFNPMHFQISAIPSSCLHKQVGQQNPCPIKWSADIYTLMTHPHQQLTLMTKCSFRIIYTHHGCELTQMMLVKKNKTSPATSNHNADAFSAILFTAKL